MEHAYTYKYIYVLHTVLTREAIRGIRYGIGIMDDYEPLTYDFRELNPFSAAAANAPNCQGIFPALTLDSS